MFNVEWNIPWFKPFTRWRAFVVGGIATLFVLWGSVLYAAKENAPSIEKHYKLTKDSIRALQTEGFAPEVTKPLETLHNQLFKSTEQFLEALKTLSPPKMTEEQLQSVLKHSLLDRLLIRSDEFSGNLNEGEGVFRGNVQGAIPKESVTFSAGKVRILKGKDVAYEKVIAENNVTATQEDKEVRAGHLVYQRGRQRLELRGAIVIKTPGARVGGEHALLNGLAETAEIKGASRSGEDHRVNMEFSWKEVSPDNPTLIEQQHATARAERVFLENVKNTATFEGNVEFTQMPRDIYLKGGKIVLNFADDQTLLFVEAEQSICLEQPGRVARAQRAFFDEKKQTIALEGDAEAYSNETRISGNTLILYLDVEKGEVKGDNKAPIEVTISLDEEPSPTNAPPSQPFRCR